MIFTLLVLTLCGGLAGGGWAVRARRLAAEASKRRAEDKAPGEVYSALPGSPCQLGDVVLKATGEEAWLAGALVFEEDALSCVLFCSPDKGGHSAVFVRVDPGAPLIWLRPIDPTSVLAMKEPPQSLELEGIRFERARRLPLKARVIGTGVPHVGSTAILAEYRTPSAEALLIVAGDERSLAYRGEVVSEGLFEVIASGKRTLDES